MGDQSKHVCLRATKTKRPRSNAPYSWLLTFYKRSLLLLTKLDGIVECACVLCSLRKDLYGIKIHTGRHTQSKRIAPNRRHSNTVAKQPQPQRSTAQLAREKRGKPKSHQRHSSQQHQQQLPIYTKRAFTSLRASARTLYQPKTFFYFFHQTFTIHWSLLWFARFTDQVDRACLSPHISK